VVQRADERTIIARAEHNDRRAEEYFRSLATIFGNLQGINGDIAQASDTLLQWTDGSRLKLSPEAAGLIAGILPIDSKTIDESVRKIINQIDSLADDMNKSAAGSWLAPSFAGLGMMTLAFELARRRRDRERSHAVFSVAPWAGPPSTWLPSRKY
jgi:hypothetical protein